MVTIAPDGGWHEALDRRLIARTVLHGLRGEQTQTSVWFDLVTGDFGTEIAVEAAFGCAFAIVGIFDAKLHGWAEVEPALGPVQVGQVLPMRRGAGRE